MSLILGCDPGFSGALAWYDTGQKRLIAAVPMPLKAPSALSPGERQRAEIDPIRLATIIQRAGVPRIAVVEKVSASPQMGVTSAFRFGEGHGVILGVLAALGVTVRPAWPSVWKSGLGLSADKRGSLKLACELFPEWGPTFQRDARSADLSEAALLAYFGVRFLPTE